MRPDAIDRIGVSLSRLRRVRESVAVNAVAQWRAESPDSGPGLALDLAAYQALLRLVSDGPMRASALAEALRADASTVSRQTAQLVGFGLVERRADPDDGRVSILAPTERGDRLAHRIIGQRRHQLARITGDWTAHELTIFAGLLERFIDGMEQTWADADGATANGTKEKQ